MKDQTIGRTAAGELIRAGDLPEFLASDAFNDAELVRIFHRRTRRQLLLLGPAGSTIARHNPIPGFRRPGASASPAPAAMEGPT